MSESELREKFKSIDSQLAENTQDIALNTSNIATQSSQISSLSNGSPKGVFANLVALQADSTANTTDGKKYTYIVVNPIGDGFDYWYYWSGGAWTIGKAYQTTGIVDESVTPKKTNFISVGKNKINENDSVAGQILDTGGISVSSSSQHTTDYIFIPSGQKIIVSPAITRSALYNTSKVFTSGSYDSTSRANWSFTATQDCYLRISYSDTRIGTMMLEFVNSSVSTPSVYELYHYLLNDQVALSSKDKIEINTSIENNKSAINVISENMKYYNAIDMNNYMVGYYYYNTGVFTTDSTRHTVKVSCIEGDMFKYTGTISGPVTAMAVLFNSSNVAVSYINVPSTQTSYVDEILTIPQGIYYIAFYSKVGFDFIIKKKQFINLVQMQDLIKYSGMSYWNNKKIAWFGTSIPMGSIINNYPKMVGDILGATVYNEAQGSSCARAGNIIKVTGTDTLGWTGEWWEHIAYGLSNTLSEKNELINNWTYWQPLLVGSPTTLSDNQKTLIRDCSYENRLARHLSNGSQPVDLFVFDHGHNDLYTQDDYKTIPAKDSTNERLYFLGAMNFLVRKILEDNPRARIIFIGHYENARKQQISECQEILANYWDFSLIKTWESLGWTQNKINTTGYWGTDGIWVASGGILQELTMTQIWIKDDLHPHTDASGKANMKIAETLAKHIDAIR